MFALRAKELRQGGVFQPISREGMLVLNNLLLVTCAATVFVGTLYPLVLEAVTGDKISVGPPFFNMTFGPLMLLLLAAMPFGPLLAWKRGDLLGAGQRLLAALVIALVIAVSSYAAYQRGPWLAPFGIALGVFVMLGALTEWIGRVKFGVAAREEVVRRALNLPRSSYGTLMAHFGIGLMLVGITGTTAYQEEKILVMKPGDTVMVGGFSAAFKGATPGRGPNYREDVATFEVTRDGAPVTVLEPSRRVYDAPPQPTTESGIHASWRGDLYLVVGDEQGGGAYAVRAYFNPLVRFIWLGALIMFLGGGVSLSDRRLRVGVPVKSRRTAAVPAE
jgi:cytochrome c-type biogenesis protein CcmF